MPRKSKNTRPTIPISDPRDVLEPSRSLSSVLVIDFVLVTALPEERDAVLDKLSGYQRLPPDEESIRNYFQADIPVTFPDNSTGKYCTIILCLSGMGRVQAVTATADAIRRWHPRYIVLVGIAGGIAAKNIQIGDILISDQVVDYELQKFTPEGPEVRWEVQRADARLLDACNNFLGESWQELIKIKRPGPGKPNLHIGPIASGDKVIAFGDVLARYRDVWQKLIGVEMEAAGVSTAAFQSSDKPGFFMVRSVSDLADENKGSTDVEKWRSYACDAAASFAITLLQSGPVPLSEGAVPVKTKRVELILEGDFSDFTQNRQQDIVGILAALLRVDQRDIRILQVYQGSIVIVIEMPESAANRLFRIATARDIRIINSGIKSVFVEDREVIEITDRPVGIQDNMTKPLRKLNFVNREYELMQIRNPGAKRFILVNGAAGYGKSHLLRCVQEYYQANYKDWKTALIDLRQNQTDLQATYLQSCSCIVDLIGAAFGEPNCTGVIADPEQMENILSASLMPVLTRQNAKILLLLDGVEILSDETSQWLKRLVSRIYWGLTDARRELRVVFAGRNVSWGVNREITIQELPLSPFDQAPVLDMVKQAANQIKMEPKPEYLEQLTWWILRISGGHPGGICNLLDVIQTKNLIFTELPYTFLRQYDFMFAGRKGSLFDVCIEPYIEELVRGNDLNLVKVLYALSPLRHFNQDLLLKLFEKNIIFTSKDGSDWLFLQKLLPVARILDITSEHKKTIAWELQKRLVLTHLIHHPTQENPMYSDQIVRRLLAMKLMLREPKRYLHVHKLALDIFDGWAKAAEHERIDAQNRRVAVQDCLYHSLMLELDTKKSQARLRASLQKRIEGYLICFQNKADELSQLQDALKKDVELENLVRWRAGETAWFDLLKTVAQYAQ